VVAIASTPDGAGKVMKELHRQGFKGRVIGSQIFADPNSLDLFGKDADGMIIVAGFWWDRTDATRAFTKKFAALNAERGLTTKKIPHHTDAQAYDIVYLLKEAMEKAKVTGDPSKLAAERTAIRDALKGIKFSGITGDNTCFNADHDARLPGFVIEIKDQKWNLFDSWPADFSDCVK
jgi:branched-chain amino acid transport system substrate-binding protein